MAETLGTSLGSLYGVPSNDSKKAFLEQLGNAEATKAFNEAFANPDPVDKLIHSVEQSSASAPGVRVILQEIKQMLTKPAAKEGSSSSTAAATDEDHVRQNINVYFEPAAVAALEVKPDVIMPGLMAKKPSVKADKMSIRGIIGAPASKKKKKSKKGKTKDKPSSNVKGYNTVPASPPTKLRPHMSVIIIRDGRKSRTSVNTGAVSIFMNGIPTVEFSRCVPYLDVVLLQTAPPIGSRGQLQSVSLVHSLRGTVSMGSDTSSPDYIIATARDVAVIDQLVKQQTQGNDTPAARQSARDKLFGQEKGGQAITTAGMEMFCAPQTLGIEPYTDYAVGLNVLPTSGGPAATTPPIEGSPEGAFAAYGGKRQAAPIDRFRPLAGIRSFSVNITPSVRLIMALKGTLELTCYDRSRLWELAPLIKPSVYGSRTQLLVTWGWSHPDGIYKGGQSPEAGSTDYSRFNAYGKLLDNLKNTQMMTATNTSYSFKPDGTVDITLSMVTSTNATLWTASIPDSENLAQMKMGLQKLTASVVEIRQKIANTPGGASINESTMLNSASSTDSALNMDDDLMDALDEFLEQPAQTKDFEKLQKTLEALKTDTQSVTSTIATNINNKIRALDKTPDPWIRANKKLKITSKKYVSLAKVLLVFVGEALLASLDRYDELQFIYYPFNGKASYMRELSLAEFPILKSSLKSKLKEFSKMGGQIPLAEFWSFLRKEYVGNIASQPYGLSSMYESGDDGVEVKDAYEDQTKLLNKTQEILKAAYGAQTSDEDLVFKLPRVAFVPETLGLKTEHVPDSTLAGGVGDNPPASSCMRIHIYDQQNSGNICEQQILRAAFDDTMGYVGKEAAKILEPDPKANPDPKHVKNFADGLRRAYVAGILVPAEKGKEVPAPPTDAKSVKGQSGYWEEMAKISWKVQSNFETVKRYVSFNMPTIVYGANASAVLDATLTTENNSKLAALSFQNSADSSAAAAPGVMAGSMPIKLMPLKLTLNTMGCPVVKVGQQFFIDFGTGSSADNIYVVGSVAHSISPGEFKTTIELRNVEAFGSFTDQSQLVEEALMRLKEINPQKVEPPAKDADKKKNKKKK